MLGFSGIPVMAQNIHYKTLEDDPYAIKPFTLHLDPFFVDAWWTDITMGWGLRADYHLGRIGSLNLEFRKPYLDMIYSNHKSESPKNIKNQTWLETTAAFNLVDKAKTRSVRITLSSSSYSSGGYTYTNTKFFNTNAEVRKIFSVRGGMYSVSTGYKSGDAKAYYIGQVVDPNNTSSTMEDTVWASGDKMFRSMAIIGGISLKSITNITVAVDDWGTRRNSSYSDFYVDFMFAPVIGLDKELNTVDGKEYDLESDNLKRMGWRMGWAYKSPVRTFMSYKFEFGARPGYKGAEGSSKILSPRAFLEMTIGVSIPFKI